MSKILFLANSNSPHVRHWSMLLNELGVEHRVKTIHDGSLLGKVSVDRYFSSLRHLGRISDYLRYISLGLLLRLLSIFGKYTDHIIHAHNTSGYGLAAWLSGRPYIVTTYGSEIFTAKQKGFLYRFLINKILAKATLVTATTEEMSKVLESEFGVTKSKIHSFSMGIDPVFYCDELQRNEFRAKFNIAVNDIVWIYNRRITPLYNTLNVVNSFNEYVVANPKSALIIMEGDSDRKYFESVELAIKFNDKIKLIRGFCGQAELRGYLSTADFSISIPNTDQMSSSILESISCGCIPILLNNEAYSILIGRENVILLQDVSIKSIAQALQDSEDIFKFTRENRLEMVSHILGDKLSSNAAKNSVVALYDGMKGFLNKKLT